MRFSLIAPALVAASSVAVVVDAAEKGVRGGRALVQGEGQLPCDTAGSCQWGAQERTDVKEFWVTHDNIFWRCHKPGLMSLTFDDGPSDNMGAVLDELKKANVTATFFINGIQIEKDPERAVVLTRAEAEGHIIAHHTYDHEESNLRVERGEDGELTPTAAAWFKRQIDDNIARAQEYLPLKGLRPYFRPPFLKLDENTSTYLEKTYNIYVVQITTDTRDFDKTEGIKSPQQISDFLTENVYAQPKDVDRHSWITLQHDKVVNTAAATPKIIAFGKALNYTFVGLDECLGFPPEKRETFTLAPTVTPCAGEPCDKTFQCRSEYGFCGTGEKFCDGNPEWVPWCLTGGIKMQFNCSAPACDDETMCKSGAGYCGTGDLYCNELSVWLPECNHSAVAGIALGVLTILSGISVMLL